ncbi:MAG: RNA methyltransferase, partial [Clostridia bacterium]|nr:RNA methyltransferase [Clostridia bacterium]
MEKITSMHNPRVQAWRSLKSKSGREEQKAFLVEGFKSVEEALKSSFELLALLVREGTPLPAWAGGDSAYEIPEHLMAAVCDTKTPQGIAAVMRLKKQRVTGKRLIALDGVQDPGN